MKLMPADIAREIPELGSQAEVEDPVIKAKFFTPWSNWTWYVIEYDESMGKCFGLVDGLDRELGYFDVPELESVRGPGGLTIERDLHWIPKHLSEVMEG